jgi:16S rRNA (adenine1518-N6/adenine1519-N6)-dimethyltransferase
MIKKPRYSQNFLVNQKILHKISQTLELTPNDVVVEIGGGHGELTKYLVKEKPKKLIVYEIDEKLAKLLKEKFPSADVRNEDFLKGDLSQFKNQYKLIGNIPYAITGKILRKILTKENHPLLLVFTLQKEVGEKILGKPKENFWSIWLKIWGRGEKIINVPAKYFRPKPKVDSLVLKIKFYSEPLVENPENFAKFLKKLFAYPNRKLKNQLIKVPNHYENLRPHELSFNEILKIYNEYYKN